MNPFASQAFKQRVSVAYTYDAAQRLTGIDHRKGADRLVSFAYTLDSVGNRTSKTQTGLNLGLTPMNPFTETYAYDPVDQLIQAKYGSLRTVGYQYDATGNRQTVVDGSVTTTYTANADTTGGWEASGETAAGSPKGETSGNWGSG